MSSTRLAVCSWSLQPASPRALIDRLAATGLDAVQLALSPLVAADPGPWADTREALAGAGIRIVSGMMATHGEDYSTLETIAVTGGVRPDAHWPRNRDHAAAVANLAASMGIDLVTFHAGFIPEDPADPERAVLLDRLRTVADLFAAAEVRLGFETGQESADTLVEALEALDHPNVCVNFDPANMILYAKGDPVAAIRRLAPWVGQVHVKDAVATTTPGTWGREVPVGTGDVDWPAFMAEATAIDPPVDFVIEREAGPDRADDIRAAVRVVAPFLAGRPH